ncbi:glycosyltransferase [Patescibacteria group bacterium]|nr:glycosyltransferase [Patescibacteria group bacterium]
MKQKKLTVTIGIPAHNEEANIATLLRSLLDQKENVGSLKKIFVYSDASTDRTVEEVRRIKSRKIELVQTKRRLGKPSITNFFFKQSQTDVVVILDADIELKGRTFLDQLILPIAKKKADLTSAKVMELAPITFIEKVLRTSMTVKRVAFEAYLSGNNMYTCHGRARAFSRDFYRNFLANPDVASDDAYSFIMCQQMGYTYQYAPKAVLLYRLPQTLNDHLRQSTRFFQGQKQLLRYFPHAVIQKTFYLPTSLKLRSLFTFAIRYPLSFIAYLAIIAVSKAKSVNSSTHSAKWSVASSSKALR